MKSTNFIETDLTYFIQPKIVFSESCSNSKLFTLHDSNKHAIQNQCSKLFEKVLHHRVYSYLTKHNLINKRQYSFRENHSTESAITTICDELLKNFDNKLITCSLLLVLSKVLTVVPMKFCLINHITTVQEVFRISYSQIFYIMKCSAPK